MKGLTLAILALLIALTLYLYKEHTEIFNSFFNIGKNKTSKSLEQRDKNAQKKDDALSPKNADIETQRLKKSVNEKNKILKTSVIIIKVKNNIVYYSITCPNCKKADNQIHQCRNPFKGMKKMDLYRCPYCGKASKVYIEHQIENK